MRRKIQLTDNSLTSFEELFNIFETSQKAKGVAESTLSNYEMALRVYRRYLDLTLSVSEISKRDIEKMLVAMREDGLAHNSITSRLRILKTFFNWCYKEGYNCADVPNMADKETVIETYNDDELKALLQKPKKDCDFSEYRNWVIINFLLNCGCRAATVRNIKNRDVNLQYHQVICRHNKNGKIQTIPLCSSMTKILEEYMKIRGGNDDDYLFCNQYGDMLSENALRLAIGRYNKRRGVQKTSIHMFRHTFAHKFLVDCGGDAFYLQKLLAHSTLKMTKHYCRLYDTEIVERYDELSPLEKMVQKPKKIAVRR